MMQFVRSLVFNAQMYVMMLLMALFFAPLALFSREWALRACHTWCRWVIWTAKWMVGLHVNIVGTPPTEPCLVAAKHQSFFDIIVIFGSVPRGRFIMKKQLTYAPILGQFALRIGCIPVDRGKRGKAIGAMVAGALRKQEYPGQLIIYPQGTRVAPGTKAPYKIGTAILYEALDQPCVPVATNIGVFWPKRGILRRPGTATVEFLETIAPGLEKETFLDVLESRIEKRSDDLISSVRS